MNARKNKKICVVYPYQRLQERLVNVTQTLQQTGYDVEIIYWQRNNEGDRMPEHGCIKLSPILVPSAYGSLGVLVKVLIFSFRAFRRLISSKPAIIYCAHPHGLLACVLAKKFTKSKLLYDAFEFYAEDLAFWYFKRSKKAVEYLFKKIESLFLISVDTVFTIDSVGNFLHDRYSAKCDFVTVINNVPLVRSQEYKEIPGWLEVKFKGRQLISYAGGIYHGKGALKMLHLLKDLKPSFPEVSLFLAGEFHGDEIKFRETLSAFGLENEVILSGWLDYQTMIACLKKSRVGLSLNDEIGVFKLVSRGNGRKFFSYMEAGIPIIAPNFGEIGLLVKEVGCGTLVNTSNQQEIFEAIKVILENKKDSDKLGKNGLEAVTNKYNWTREVPKIREALEYLELS